MRPVLLSWSYPEGEELRWVGGTIESWNAALVEVTLEDGTTGIGEAGAGIMAAAAVPGLIRAFEPYLLGKTFSGPLDVADHLRAYTAFWSRGGITNGVAGAIEIACLDAVGKREGQPAWALLGGQDRGGIEVYASGGLGNDFGEVLEWVERQAEAGFGTVKFRAMKNPDTTIALLEHVVSRLPHGMQFVIDAVQACASNPWAVDDAIRVGHVAAELGARWYEEPCHADDVEGYARVRAAVDVPISGVESNGTVREFAELINADALDVAQPDVTFVGGPRSFQQVAAAAEKAGIQCVPHVWGSGVTFAANLHTVAATDSVRLFEFCTLANPLREGLLIEPIKLSESRIFVSSAPGLGVQVDAEIEAAFPFAGGAGHVIT